MNPRRQAVIHQQQRARRQASSTDAYAFFNMLTGPELFDCVESLTATGSSGASVLADGDAFDVQGHRVREGQVLPFAYRSREGKGVMKYE